MVRHNSFFSPNPNLICRHFIGWWWNHIYHKRIDSSIPLLISPEEHSVGGYLSQAMILRIIVLTIRRCRSWTHLENVSAFAIGKPTSWVTDPSKYNFHLAANHPSQQIVNYQIPTFMSSRTSYAPDPHWRSSAFAVPTFDLLVSFSNLMIPDHFPSNHRALPEAVAASQLQSFYYLNYGTSLILLRLEANFRFNWDGDGQILPDTRL